MRPPAGVKSLFLMEPPVIEQGEKPDPLREELSRVVRSSRARSPLGRWFRDPENLAYFTELARNGIGWRRVSAAFVKHGLIEASPAFSDPGPAGEKERDRVASLAKRTWNRVRGTAPTAQQLPTPSDIAASGARQPRVRPMAAEEPLPVVQGDTGSADALSRLDRKLGQRSGRGRG